MIVNNNNILRFLLEADTEKAEKVKDSEQKKSDSPKGFDEDPLGFILKKYEGLTSSLEKLMSNDFKQYLTAIFVVAPKPTTFKIVLHNGQFFFMTFMGRGYEANIAGKRYYLDNIGTEERAMEAIARLLKFGSPLNTKGPDGAEQSTRGDESGGSGGSNFGGGGSSATEQGESGEEGGEGSEEESNQEEIKESLINQDLISSIIKESKIIPSLNVMKQKLLEELVKTEDLFKAVQKQLTGSGFKVETENKANRGRVLRVNFNTSNDVNSIISKSIEKVLPVGSFNISEFEKKEGESKSSTYPTFKIQVTKDINNYKKGGSVFIVSTTKTGASTKSKALTPLKLGLTDKKFKDANSLAATIKKNIPTVTDNNTIKEALDGLTDSILAGSSKNKFKNVNDITAYNEQIPFSDKTTSALSKLTPQDIGAIGSDFGECLGAVALLNSVANTGDGLYFPPNEKNPLADFQLDGYNISSKYNKGGAASIVDATKSIDRKQLTTPNQKKLFKVFDIVIKENAIVGPLEIAKFLKLEGLNSVATLIGVKSPDDVTIEKINAYLNKILAPAKTDEQKTAIIQKKLSTFYTSIKKSPRFDITWRDIAPNRYFGLITAPFANYVANSLNNNKIYKQALKEVMSKSEVKQLYLTMNLKKNFATFKLKNFSSSDFLFDSALSIYNPSVKKLAFRVL